MTIYQFKHPTKEVTYSWNLGEGLLYKDGQNPVGLDRTTQKGELLYRFLKFKKVNQYGLNNKVEGARTEIVARTYIPIIMESLDIEGDRKKFIRTIPNRGGYEWLLEVETIEEEPKRKKKNRSWDGEGETYTQKTGSPLFLDQDIDDLEKTNPLFSHTIDATVLIHEKTQDFVGRDFIFKELDRFIGANDRGYFVIRGDPGIGKTALMAHLVLERRCVHHFNVRGEGISRTDLFLQNLCAQLILKYRLPYRDLPPEATRDASFLKGLLAEISSRLAKDEKAIILVDALDEVDPGMSGANTLFLPLTLPRGVYFVVSMRRTKDVKLRFDCAGATFNIEHDAKDNLRDVSHYIELKIELQGIDIYISNQKLDRSGFIEKMTEKSEGNFMYLRHVLPEIADGAYRNRPIADIPVGLKSYYTDHWWRMRGLNEDAWHQYRLPVVLALTIVREPVTFELISQFSGVAESSHIYGVLDDWHQFLHIREVPVNEHRQKRYRIYHTSYQEFIKEKDEVKEKAAERGYKPEVDLKQAHQKIADVLIKDLIDAGILEKDFDKDPPESPQ